MKNGKTSFQSKSWTTFKGTNYIINVVIAKAVGIAKLPTKDHENSKSLVSDYLSNKYGAQVYFDRYKSMHAT